MIASISAPETMLWLALCGLMVFLSAIYSGAETGLYCINRLRLNLMARQNDAAAITVKHLQEDEAGMLFTTLLGTNIANYLAPVCLTVIYLNSGLSEHHAELYTTLILAPTILIFAEILPKVLFERHADRLVLRFSPILSASYRVFRLLGLIAAQNRISRFVLKTLHRRGPSGLALYSRMELYHLLREGGAEGALTRTQMFMLERFHTLKTTRVGGVMVPLSHAVMLPDTARAADAIRVIRNSAYSRFPVYRGGRQYLIGSVHALDILMAKTDAPITDRLYPPVEVKLDTSVMETLSLLQQRHRRMAFVIDNNGRCVGIVTVKDLVEEIVGELAAW